jgi:hypothetical protein
MLQIEAETAIKLMLSASSSGIPGDVAKLETKRVIYCSQKNLTERN